MTGRSDAADMQKCCVQILQGGPRVAPSGVVYHPVKD